MPGYTYPGTDCVKNKLGAITHDELEKREGALVAFRQYEISLGHGPKGQFDANHIKAIHQHLFQDVFEWAGRTRDERVKLSDGEVATETSLRKPDGKEFLTGPFIPSAMDALAQKLQGANYLRDLPRTEFAERAADIMADLNAIHPFREGNGRTQRIFMQELAKEAGHDLDFAVVSKERMVEASIAANERDDPTKMRRLFSEISDPSRTEALREAIEAFDKNKFKWNDCYLATTEPGHKVELTMAGVAGAHFMGRANSEILIGKTSDLPDPLPGRGEKFTYMQNYDMILDKGTNNSTQEGNMSILSDALDIGNEVSKDTQEAVKDLISGGQAKAQPAQEKQQEVTKAQEKEPVIPADIDLDLEQEHDWER